MGCLRWALLFLTVMFALGGGPSIGHGPFEPPPITVEGELADLACFVAHKARGGENAICASHHTTPHQPLALIADGGEIHLLYADHKSPYPHDRCRELAGRRVRLTGVPATDHGLRLLAVRKVEPLDTLPEGQR